MDTLFDTPSRRFGKIAEARLIVKGYPEYDDNQARGKGGKWTAGGAAAAAAGVGAAALGAGALALRLSPLYRGTRALDAMSIGPRLRAWGVPYPSVFTQTLSNALVGNKLENRGLRALGNVAGLRNRQRDLYHGLRATGSSKPGALFGALGARRGQDIGLRATGRVTGAIARTKDMAAGLGAMGSSRPRAEAVARQAGLTYAQMRRLGLGPAITPRSTAGQNRTLRRVGWAVRRIKG